MNFVKSHILPNMIHVKKLNTLSACLEKEQRSFHKSKVYISKEEFCSMCKDIKFSFGNKRYWHNQEFLTKTSFYNFMDDLEYEGIVRNLYDKIEKIECISAQDGPKEFYDLSMANGAQHNYIGGKRSFSFIHNTGSGGAENLSKLAFQLGKPVIVIFALPMSSEDTIAKHNSIHTLAELAELAKEGTISSLFVCDNSRIEYIYPNLPLSEFWGVCNNAIVNPIHLFNSLSASPSKHISLDPMDMGRVLLAGNCTISGMVEIEDYLEEDAIAEAVVNNMADSLLASEFDITQTTTAGVIITSSGKVLSQISANHLEYAMAMFNKITSDGTAVYRGVYEVEDHPDVVRVYTILSGLGLPQERVKELKLEAQKHMEALEQKENMKDVNMTIDLGKSKSVSATDVIHRRIKNKKSAVGKLTKNAKRIVDKRKR